MTREEAVEKLKKLKDVMDLYTILNEASSNKPYIAALEMSIEALEEQETNRWIPISERLPEESLNSIIGWDSFRKKSMFVQFLNGHFQVTGKVLEPFDIKAWMPMPAPFEEVEKMPLPEAYKED